MREISFLIDTDGIRVDRFLRRLGVSRHLLTILKTIPDGITVAGKRIRTVDMLHTGDRLTLRVYETAEENHIIPTPAALDILYEDEDMMIIDKPAGMAVHPSQGNHEGTVANALAYLYGERGEPFVFRAIGRLDKNTSGLLAVAKNMFSACILTEQAACGKLHREYLAVCEGALPALGMIDAPIGRVSDSVILRAVKPDGRRAVTHFERLDCRNGCSLARVWLDTGRTHQIRVHFAYIGHPLLGDFLYAPELPGTGRHALHAYSLRLHQPVTGKVLTFCTSLPSELSALLYGDKEERGKIEEWDT